jgi:hypothetical protein
MNSPTSTPLSIQAQAWLARLPAPVRVHGLAAQAPDLANRIADVWHAEEQTAALLELMLAEEVHAMPVNIAAELLRLYEYHARCRVADAPGATWELPVLARLAQAPSA